MKLIDDMRDIKRFKDILSILFEEGFGYLLSRLNLTDRIPFSKRLKKKIKHERAEVKLRRTLERLGPTFIKFGQLLSIRPDLIPNNYVKELEKLQDKVPAFEFKEAEKTVETSLNKKISRVFSEFDEKPLASASIAQVHKAKLKSGEVVAVKVRRPNIREIMETDIDIMIYIARLLEKRIVEVRKFKPVRIVEEFAEWTRRELDLRNESKNAIRFYNNFKKSNSVFIPKVYVQFSREDVLILEYIEGIEIREIEKIKKKKLDIDTIIDNGFQAILVQVFEHGFFHADPHPGNIFVLKDNRVAFVDFGIVGRFSHDLKNKSINIFTGIMNQNIDLVVDSLLDLGENKDIDVEKFRRRIEDVILPLQRSSLKEVKISRVLEETLNIAINFGVRMPVDFILFGKTIVTIEGIALKYNPNFVITEHAKPFVRKLIKQRYSPEYIVQDIKKNAHKYRRLAEIFPERAERIFKKIEDGTIKLDVEDQGIRKLAVEIDKSSNRLAYSLIIAALVVAGALVVNVGTPILFGTGFLSLLCFLMAGFIGVLLIFSIMNERKSNL